LRLTPTDPEIPEIGGFTDKNDPFELQLFAERLGNLVQNIDEPLVLTLDGGWGSGKSVFIKQWAGLMRAKGASIIEFDAFANDYYEDAFLPLSARIYSAVESSLDGADELANDYIESAKKVGKLLLPMALRVATRVGTAGLINSNELEAVSEDVKSAISDLGSDGSQILENLISERLIEAKEEENSLNGFRESLSNLATRIAENDEGSGEKFPLIFIVDELDRCRPTFALDIIERTKHLFSVKGVCFIFVANLVQLEQAVQGAYGATFDARTYLEKFFQVRISLPISNEPNKNQLKTYISLLWDSLKIEFPDGRYSELVREGITALAVANDISLRRIERIMTNIALASASARADKIFIPPIIACLCFMRQTHWELYLKCKTRSASWDEIEEFLRPIILLEGRRGEWTRDWWRYCLAAMSDEAKRAEFRRGIANYNVDDPGDIVVWMAEYIDNFSFVDEPSE